MSSTNLLGKKQPSSNNVPESISMTLEQFQQMNDQLVDLRTKLFDSDQKQKKFDIEFQKLKKANSDLENEVKKYQGKLL